MLLPPATGRNTHNEAWAYAGSAGHPRILQLLSRNDSSHLFLPFIKMESGEETPLLPSPKNLDHDQVYTRFTIARKRGILAIESLVGLIPRTYFYPNTELMISFCLRNFHPFYTPNCPRPRFDRTHRRVNTLSCRKLIIFPPRWLYRLAVSISILGLSLGAIVGSSLIIAF